jgi:hypothetical protein
LDVAYCEACRHIQPLHLGGRGKCRLNGCPCTAFAVGPVVEPGPQLVEVPTRPSPLWVAIPAAIAFVIGLALGLSQ